MNDEQMEALVTWANTTSKAVSVLSEMIGNMEKRIEILEKKHEESEND